jgi:hypothetical protein
MKVRQTYRIFRTIFVLSKTACFRVLNSIQTALVFLSVFHPECLSRENPRLKEHMFGGQIEAIFGTAEETQKYGTFFLSTNTRLLSS